MIRSFLPVGQGAFYCEQFLIGNAGEKVNVVYDCGSLTDVDLIKEQIESNFIEAETIHGLFISHLDEDHINGVTYLLKRCRVRKIFFPLLTQEDKELTVIEHIIKYGEQEGFLRAFINDPYNAVKQLNLQYEPELYQISEWNEDLSNTNDLMVGSGQNLFEYIFNDIKIDREFENDWRFIPFNFRQKERVEQLYKNLENLFGCELTAKDLESKWRSGILDDRKKIKEAYAEIKGSLNTNSMTLYSGKKSFELGQRIACIPYDRCWNGCYSGVTGVGCLYLGDYDARGTRKWEDLHNAYKEYWNNIGCVQIPHHGSKHNYNCELAKLDAYCIISAGESNKYQHPHSFVTKDLLLNGRFPYIVSNRKCSEVKLVVETL